MVLVAADFINKSEKMQTKRNARNLKKTTTKNCRKIKTNNQIKSDRRLDKINNIEQ